MQVTLKIHGLDHTQKERLLEHAMAMARLIAGLTGCDVVVDQDGLPFYAKRKVCHSDGSVTRTPAMTSIGSSQ